MKKVKRKRRRKSSLKFAEDLSRLRLAASVVYDRGVALGKTQKELMEDVKPLREALDRMVKTAVTEDISGMIAAIRLLENEAKAHQEDAKYLIEKSEQAKEHAEMLKAAIKSHMNQSGKQEVMDSGFSATLIGDTITLR